jgi:4-hydroxy-2-oxoheptanedioate aldolase
MPHSPIKARLLAGESVFGIWSLIPSPALIELIGTAGMDFVILDAEHGPYDISTLEDCISAAESVNCAPLVRVPGLDAQFIQRALDLGPHGIVVPQVADYEAAQKAVACMHYAPRGTRGFNPFTRAGHYGVASKKEQSKQTSDFTLSCVMIENQKAFHDLDRILAIPDLDMIYLGVYDYSVLVGCPGKIDDPRVVEFMEICARKTRAAGKILGMLAKTPEGLKRFIDLGATLITWLTDTWLIQGAVVQSIDIFHKARAGK